MGQAIFLRSIFLNSKMPTYLSSSPRIGGVKLSLQLVTLPGKKKGKKAFNQKHIEHQGSKRSIF
jgi:hypothetical protein